MDCHVNISVFVQHILRKIVQGRLGCRAEFCFAGIEKYSGVKRTLYHRKTIVIFYFLYLCIFHGFGLFLNLVHFVSNQNACACTYSGTNYCANACISCSFAYQSAKNSTTAAAYYATFCSVIHVATAEYECGT